MADNARKMTVTEIEQALAQNRHYLALLFTAQNCPQCPAAVRALTEAERSGKVRALMIDSDASLELVDYAGVMATPTLQLFRGAELVQVVTGNRVPRFLAEFGG